MGRPSVAQFISDKRAEGLSDSEITHSLLDAGWHMDIIHKAMKLSLDDFRGKQEMVFDRKRHSSTKSNRSYVAKKYGRLQTKKAVARPKTHPKVASQHGEPIRHRKHDPILDIKKQPFRKYAIPALITLLILILAFLATFL